MSTGAKVAAPKNVDLPVLGFPITPNSLEYDLCMKLNSPFCVSVCNHGAILFVLHQWDAQRLIDNATAIGANAIIGADFETSDILQGTATLFSAYGTAVVVEPAQGTA